MEHTYKNYGRFDYGDTFFYLKVLNSLSCGVCGYLKIDKTETRRL